jgi:hypothetical protein
MRRAGNRVPWGKEWCLNLLFGDLNNAGAEAHVMPEVYARMPRGGIIVFDDYGFKGYKNSALVYNYFLRDRPENILELLTG